MDFKIVRKYDEFLLLKEEWDEIVLAMKNTEVFFVFDWINCFLTYYKPEYKEKLCIVTGYEKNKLEIILPFMLEENTLNYLTTEGSDYNMIYLKNSNNKYIMIKKAIAFLLEKEDVRKVCLTNMPSSAELFFLQEIFREEGFSAYLQESVIVPYYSYKQNFVDKKQLADIKRREKKLATEATMEFLSENKIDEKEMTFLVANRNKKYKDSSLKNKKACEFYIHLPEYIPEYFKVDILKIDNNIAALHYGFKFNRKYYYYFPAYAEMYSSKGVGMILLKHIIDGNNDCNVFDFLKGGEKYKFYWSESAKMNFHLLAYKKGKEQAMLKVLLYLKNKPIVRRIMGR